MDIVNETLDKVLSNKYRLVLDTPLIMQRFSQKNLHDMNDLLSSMNVEDIRPSNILPLCSFLGVKTSELIDEYCILIERT